VIGIVGHGHVVPRPFGELPVTGTPITYVEAVLRSGARPVIVPPRTGAALLDVVDGLVLTGGGDLDPALSGAGGPACDVDGERDETEIALVRLAAERRIPLLGACRGLQVMAVALGGTLTGGLDHLRPHDGHEVRTAAGSLVRDLVGDRVRTTALHQQAVREPGSHWLATAWAEDGVVEAIEPLDPDWPALGVQWHPELSAVPIFEDPTGPALFSWLAAAARTYSWGYARPS
jgi:putative glutamine amidotransferase